MAEAIEILAKVLAYGAAIVLGVIFFCAIAGSVLFGIAKLLGLPI
jgi:hypothetical protein